MYKPLPQHPSVSPSHSCSPVLSVFCLARAIAYKEDGNESFKIKQYREAVLAYTEGIQQQSVDRQLNAILYSNRAAAQYRLGEECEENPLLILSSLPSNPPSGNYRSCIADATQARKYNPDYLKAIVKGVVLCFYWPCDDHATNC